MSDVTRILSAIEQGDPHAAGQSCNDTTSTLSIWLRRGRRMSSSR
jgi:hypothetical protein